MEKTSQNAHDKNVLVRCAQSVKRGGIERYRATPKEGLWNFRTYQTNLVLPKNVDGKLRGADQLVDFLLRGPARKK